MIVFSLAGRATGILTFDGIAYVGAVARPVFLSILFELAKRAGVTKQPGQLCLLALPRLREAHATQDPRRAQSAWVETEARQ